MFRIVIVFILCLTSLFADFPFKAWQGIEKILKDTGLKRCHPMYGKIALNLHILENLRLMSGLYDYDPNGHGGDQPKSGTGLKNFAAFLKEMFPSNSGVFMSSALKSSVSYNLTPHDIGVLVYELQTFQQMQLSNTTLKQQFDPRNVDNKPSNDPNSFFLRYKNNLDKATKRQENIENFIATLVNAQQEINQQNYFPKTLVMDTLLAFFWKRFSMQNDLASYLEALKIPYKTKQDEPWREWHQWPKKAKVIQPELQLIQQHDETLDSFKQIDSPEQLMRLYSYVHEILNPIPYESGNLSWNSHAELFYNQKGITSTKEDFITTFSNCVEASMMQFLDLLIFDGEIFNTTFLQKLPQATRLLEYFSNYRGEKGSDATIPFLQVVSNLGDKKFKDQVYKQFSKGIRFEVKSGFIRMLRVFEKVLGIDLTKIDTKQESIEQAFQTLVSTISPKKIECTLNGYKVIDGDVFGTLNITVLKGGSEECSFEWEMTNGHSGINNLKSEENTLFDDGMDLWDDHSKNLYQNDQYKEIVSLQRPSSDPFYNLYSNSLVANTDGQIQFLKVKAPLDPEAKNQWIGLENSVFNSINFDDPGTAKKAFEAMKTSDLWNEQNIFSKKKAIYDFNPQYIPYLMKFPKLETVFFQNQIPRLLRTSEKRNSLVNSLDSLKDKGIKNIRLWRPLIKEKFVLEYFKDLDFLKWTSLKSLYNMHFFPTIQLPQTLENLELIYRKDSIITDNTQNNFLPKTLKKLRVECPLIMRDTVYSQVLSNIQQLSGLEVVSLPYSKPFTTKEQLQDLVKGPFKGIKILNFPIRVKNRKDFYQLISSVPSSIELLKLTLSIGSSAGNNKEEALNYNIIKPHLKRLFITVLENEKAEDNLYKEPISIIQTILENNPSITYLSVDMPENLDITTFVEGVPALNNIKILGLTGSETNRLNEIKSQIEQKKPNISIMINAAEDYEEYMSIFYKQFHRIDYNILPTELQQP